MSDIQADITTNMVISAIRGLVGSINTYLRPMMEAHPSFGSGKKFNKTQMQQVIAELIYKDCLAEVHKVSARGFSIIYLTVGTNMQKLLNREITISISQPKEKIVESPPPAVVSNTIEETPFVEECEAELSPRIPEHYCTKLYEGLIASRSMFASFFGSAAASVMTNPVMEEISKTVPTKEEELVTIDKMTPIFVKKFGSSILNVIKEFLANYHIELTKPFISRGLLRKQQQEKYRSEKLDGSGKPKNVNPSDVIERSRTVNPPNVIAIEETKNRNPPNVIAMEKAKDKNPPNIIDIDDDLFKECDEIEQQMSQAVVTIPIQPTQTSHSKYFHQTPSPIKSNFVSYLKNKRLSDTSSSSFSQIPSSLSQRENLKRSCSDDDFSLFSDLCDCLLHLKGTWNSSVIDSHELSVQILSNKHKN